MNVIFYISSAVAVFATILVITRTDAVHALLYLVVSLLAMAMVFFTLGAPFAAALEVVIYAGAIVVLLVFVVMMLNQGPVSISQERAWLRPRIWIGPGILSLVLLGELAYVLVGQPAGLPVGQSDRSDGSDRSDRSDQSDMSDGSEGLRPQVSSLQPPVSSLPLLQSAIRNPQSAISQSPKAVGLALFGPYVIGVELASLLLLAGLVAAFHLGKHEDTERESASSPVGQFASSPVGQSACRPVNQSASRPVNQSASRPVCQSTSLQPPISSIRNPKSAIPNLFRLSPDSGLQEKDKGGAGK